jgi:uncharacterized protein YlxW (UPF0749 family)
LIGVVFGGSDADTLRDELTTTQANYRTAQENLQTTEERLANVQTEVGEPNRACQVPRVIRLAASGPSR